MYSFYVCLSLPLDGSSTREETLFFSSLYPSTQPGMRQTLHSTCWMRGYLKQNLEDRDVPKGEEGEVSQGPRSVPRGLTFLLWESLSFWVPTMSGSHHLAPQNFLFPAVGWMSLTHSSLLMMPMSIWEITGQPHASSLVTISAHLKPPGSECLPLTGPLRARCTPHYHSLLGFGLITLGCHPGSEAQKGTFLQGIMSSQKHT